MTLPEPRWLDLNADEEPGDVVLPVEVRVKQGMALLDEKHGPGWVHKIDVESLDVAGNCSCVLGQLYGDYGTGLFSLFPRYRIGDTTNAGFFASDGAVWCPGEWDELTTAWRLAILARRAEATL